MTRSTVKYQFYYDFRIYPILILIMIWVRDDDNEDDYHSHCENGDGTSKMTNTNTGCFFTLGFPLKVPSPKKLI